MAEQVRLLIETAADEQHLDLANKAVALEAKDQLARHKLVTKEILCNASTDDLASAGITMGARIVLKTLFPSPAGLPPWQLDAVSSVHSRPSMYVILRITNDRVEPPITLEADVLVDAGCTPELILPKRKAEQLRLGIRDTKPAVGYGGGKTAMIVYSAVKVELDLTNEGSDVVVATKCADLTPLSKENEPGWAGPAVGPVHQFAGFRDQPVNTEVVKLSPVMRRVDGGDPPGILGFPGLRKLGLQLDPEKYRLLHVTEDEMIV